MTQRSSTMALRRARTAVLAAGLLGVVLASPQAVAQASGQKPAVKSRTAVTLNFVNADIEAVSRAMGAMLDRQILVDPRVKGTITLYSEQPLSTREAYLNYLAALRGLGFAVVESGGLLKVVPEADAKLQTGTVAVGAVPRSGDQILTQIFRLNYENANTLVSVLRPLISPNNTINANPSNNTLVITDYADNLQRLGKIIATMDTPATGDVDVIPLQHGIASDLAPLVQRLAEPTVAPGGAPTPGASTLSVMADSRSNALIVRAPNPARQAVVRSLVEKLDRPSSSASPTGNIYVVYLKNADAVRLAAVLRAAYAANVGAAAQGGISPTGVTPTQPIATPPSGGITGGITGSTSGASTASTAPVAASASPSTGGFIQADPATNSLIITAPDPVYRQIRAVIDQLDSRRAQVYIESMIVKVDANKAAQFGFQWQHLFGNTGDSTVVGAGTNFPGGGNIIDLSIATAGGRAGVAAGRGNVPSGLNIGVLRKVNNFFTLGALAKFLESNTGGNVLSTPNLISLDNEEAKIVIGQNVPFITGSFTNTGAATGTVNPFQTIERRDVGLTLRVKPQIGENGTVRMTIYQENSSVVPSTTSSTTGPTTDKSAIETTVVVDDGQIMVLGGLLKDEFTNGEDKVPGLGDIPVLGNLFRSESRTRVKTNLMVFLRPVVVRSQQAADSLSMDRYDSIRALQRNVQPPPSVLVPINEAPILPELPAPLVPSLGTVPGTQPPGYVVPGAGNARAAPGSSGAPAAPAAGSPPAGPGAFTQPVTPPAAASAPAGSN
jgi:general secretion pathway protein D